MQITIKPFDWAHTKSLRIALNKMKFVCVCLCVTKTIEHNHNNSIAILPLFTHTVYVFILHKLSLKQSHTIEHAIVIHIAWIHHHQHHFHSAKLESDHNSRLPRQTNRYREKSFVAAAHKENFVFALIDAKTIKRKLFSSETKMNRIISNKTHFVLIRMSCMKKMEAEKKPHENWYENIL